MEALISYFKREKITAVEHCSMSRYSTFRIGGTARLAVFPKNRDQLLRAASAVADAGVPCTVVGRGSNLLFPDKEYAGVVILTVHVIELRSQETELEADAGVPLIALATRARNLSLGGAEFAAGIPGTVGGAVLMNAGAFGGCMEQIVTWVDCWNTKKKRVERFEAGAHGFGYRTSLYAKSPQLILLGVGFSLPESDEKEIDRLMEEYRRRRADTQPKGYPNCGSIFKNPEGDSAGRLIEACGLKGARVGGAVISEKHANFIVNAGGACARDVRALIALAQNRVEAETGIRLQCELRELKP